MIAKDVDDIMISIRNNYKDYEISGEDAKIIDDKITPGVCGRKIDINKSYYEMKKIGLYDSKLYNYYYEKPAINLKNNYNKLIVNGNSNNNYIYIFVELTEDNKKYILESKFSNYNFIVNSEFYMNNVDIIDSLKEQDNSVIISSVSYKNYKSVSSDYLKKYKKNIYCVNDEKNEFLDICSSNKSNTVYMQTIISQDYLLNIKKNTYRGAFIKVILNKDFINNKEFIEKYIDSKGIILSSVDSTLSECGE